MKKTKKHSKAKVRTSVKSSPKPKTKKPAFKLPKSEAKKYKELLLKERERISGGLTHIAENTLKKSQRDASGDLSGYSFHMADQATDDYDVEFSLGRATEDQRLLFKVDEALKRVKEGTYGMCQQCGGKIAKERLKALPYTDVCIECQRSNDTR